MDKAITLCAETKVCIQAGGNVGVWASYLSERFDVVYTFEPDCENFDCLSLNLQGIHNIVKFQAALGDTKGCVEMTGDKNNCGAYQAVLGGIVPIIRIDDLGIDPDLIVLDIEGMETEAFMGAMETIERCKPVIMFEDKGLSRPVGEVEKLLKGYEVREKVHRDVILSSS